MIGVASEENRYCAQKNGADALTSSWKDVFEATKKCREKHDCHMFYDHWGKGEKFKYCSRPGKEIDSGRGSILYKPGE